MIILTGAAGFIGSVLLKALNERGIDDVIAVDTLGSKGKFLNLRGKQFDLLSPDALPGLLDSGALKPQAILHIGANTNTADPDADAMYRKNTQYTHRLAEIAVREGIRFVYASSASVYGDGAFGFSDDDALTPQLQPLNPYAWSKWLFDAQAIKNGWTDKIAGLRFFNVFGPNEYHKGFMASVIWHAYKQALETGKIKLFQSHRPDYGDGEQRRDFIYVDDLARVILWLLDNPNANGIFNLGTGQARTYNDLAAAIFGALDKKPEIEYVPTPESIRNSYQYYTQADMTKLKDAGYPYPFTSLEDAIGSYVREHLQKSNPYR